MVAALKDVTGRSVPSLTLFAGVIHLRLVTCEGQRVGTWAGNAGRVETTPPMRLLKKLSPGRRIAASMKTRLAILLGICCSNICIHTPAREWPTNTTFCKLFIVITCSPRTRSRDVQSGHLKGEDSGAVNL